MDSTLSEIWQREAHPQRTSVPMSTVGTAQRNVAILHLCLSVVPRSDLGHPQHMHESISPDSNRSCSP